MTFSKALKQELRDTFGPAWISTITMYGTIAVFLVLAATVGAETLKLAEGLALTLTEIGVEGK